MRAVDPSTPTILKNYFDGQWCATEQLESLDVDNPSTREVLARVPISDQPVIDYFTEQRTVTERFFSEDG